MSPRSSDPRRSIPPTRVRVCLVFRFQFGYTRAPRHTSRTHFPRVGGSLYPRDNSHVPGQREQGEEPQKPRSYRKGAMVKGLPRLSVVPRNPDGVSPERRYPGRPGDTAGERNTGCLYLYVHRVHVHSTIDIAREWFWPGHPGKGGPVRIIHSQVDGSLPRTGALTSEREAPLPGGVGLDETRIPRLIQNLPATAVE